MTGLREGVRAVYEFELANKGAGTAASFALNFLQYRRPGVLDVVVRERLVTALADLARDGEGDDAAEAGKYAELLK